MIKNLKDIIIYDDNPKIRKISNNVSLPLSEESLEICRKLKKYIDYSVDKKKNKKGLLKPGVGISAIQIGEPVNIIYLNFSWNGEKINYTLVNSKVISHSHTKAYLEGGEGCLSVKEKVSGLVYRYYKIKIRAFILEKMKEEVLEFEGFSAIVVQHELDHLKGIIFTDYINKIVNNDPGDNPIEI